MHINSDKIYKNSNKGRCNIEEHLIYRTNSFSYCSNMNNVYGIRHTYIHSCIDTLYTHTHTDTQHEWHKFGSRLHLANDENQ